MVIGDARDPQLVGIMAHCGQHGPRPMFCSVQYRLAPEHRYGSADPDF